MENRADSLFRYRGVSYLTPFLLISTLFFLWGFAHSILEVLNPHFQDHFHISKTKAAMVQAAVYGGYFLMALPVGAIIRRWGYRVGVLTGLVLYGVGALLFIPGARINSFWFFVFSLFVIGCGLTCLETSANPYATRLGAPSKAEVRINLSQSLNGVGWVLGPLVGGQLLFTGVSVAVPYALVGGVVLLVALLFSRVKLPDQRGTEDAETAESRTGSLWNLHFVLGTVALFLYVAAQTGVNSFFITYMRETTAVDSVTASRMLSFGGMGLFVVGRLAGSGLMNRLPAVRVLMTCAVVASLATMVIICAKGAVTVGAFFFLYLAESIMFPTIFAMSLRHCAGHTEMASSVLIMTIVGGAIAPVLMGLFADHWGGVALAFLVPLVCYVYIALYCLTERRLS